MMSALVSPSQRYVAPRRLGARLLQSLLALILIASLLHQGITPAAAQPVASGPIDPAELAAFVDGVMASGMSANHVPGAVVTLVKEGQVFFAKGYGSAGEQAKTPVDPARTLFRPGSISKLFTWTAVMQLVEQGKLSVDADVNTYIDFKIPATFPEPITMKNLMTHTPGFEDKGDGLFKLKAAEVAPLGDYLKQNLPARVFPPGKIGAYSNYGVALAGYIVERISGLPFAEYIDRNIFAPLGMTHATFRQPLPEALAADMSGGYNYSGGSYLQGGFEYVVGSPAGALSASGLDMARFMIAHLQNGRFENTQILKEATARQMHTRLLSADPRLGGMAYGFFENMINGQYVISHGGDTMLFHSGLFLLPDQNIGLFVSTNGIAGGNLVGSLREAFFNRYFPVRAMPAPILAPDFASRSAAYAGSYFISRSNFTTLEKLLTLMNPIRVSVDASNTVSVSMGGQVTQYIETEPGLLVSRENPDVKIVMKEENGQVYLFTSSPFVLIKTSAQGNPVLHLLIFGGGALLFLAILLGWGFGFLRGLFRREPRPFAARMARFTAWLYALGFLAFLVLLAGAFTTMEPAYGVPAIYFSIPAWMETLMKLPILLGLLGVAMLLFTILAWRKRYWTLVGRLGYTGITLAAMVSLWALNYWNLLL